MITNILIDIDNTILDFDLCSEWCVRQSEKEMGVVLPENIMDIFKEVTGLLWGRLEKKELTIEDIKNNRWKMIFEKLRIDADGHKFEEAFRKYLYKSKIEEKGAREALEYLSRKYKVYAASNGPTGQQKNRMKVSAMDNYLSGYFISEEAGSSKPSREFFEYCFERMQINTPGEVMMIGDSLNADICGAIAVGISTCWYNKNRAVSDDVKPDHIINEWKEIRKIL